MDEHAVVVADTTGTITRWNAAAEELFGYDADDALGHSLDLIVPEHLRMAHWKGFHRAMAHPQIKDLAADRARSTAGASAGGRIRRVGRGHC